MNMKSIIKTKSTELLNEKNSEKYSIQSNLYKSKLILSF